MFKYVSSVVILSPQYHLTRVLFTLFKILIKINCEKKIEDDGEGFEIVIKEFLICQSF